MGNMYEDYDECAWLAEISSKLDEILIALKRIYPEPDSIEEPF